MTTLAPMIDSLQIKNFKCFRTLSLSDLGTLNVVVSDNASGKTALLESIFLSQVANPEVVFRMRLFRGLGGNLALSASRAAYEALWKHLFFNFDQQKRIEIKATGNTEQARSLSIFYDPDQPAEIALPAGAATQSDAAAITPITFEYTAGASEEPKRIQPSLSKGGISFGGLSGPPSLCAFYSSSFSTVVAPEELANQFSNMRKTRKQHDFKRIMRLLYPQIRDFSVETDGGTTMLYCDVKGLPELVPVNLVSAGLHKLAAILVGMTSHPRGVILIDEIENGFYFEKMPEIWRALVVFCKKLSGQLFVTTHSKECLQALLPSLRENEKHVRLIRIENKKGVAIAKSFQGKEFEAAIEMDVDFR